MFKFMFEKIANLLIKNFQNFPTQSNFDNWEVFNHSDYLNGSSKVKKLFRLKSFLIRYNIEKYYVYSIKNNIENVNERRTVGL